MAVAPRRPDHRVPPVRLSGPRCRAAPVAGQDPAALRRYGFLDALVPEELDRPWPLRRAVPT
ncbi:hypothetical protein ACWCQY_24940, partial [Streptomyces sp. NPDC002078]